MYEVTVCFKDANYSPILDKTVFRETFKAQCSYGDIHAIFDNSQNFIVLITIIGDVVCLNRNNVDACYFVKIEE